MSKFNVSANEGHSALAPDEPTFTFRGQDKLMAKVLLYYAQLCDEEGASYEHTQAVYNCRDDVIAWQTVNGCGIPD